MWNNNTPFDYIAENYDRDFSNSLIGTTQRNFQVIADTGNQIYLPMLKK